MELKRILAKDSRSASEEAMDKYGRDVLIISSNRVNGLTEFILAVEAVSVRQGGVGQGVEGAIQVDRAEDGLFVGRAGGAFGEESRSPDDQG